MKIDFDNARITSRFDELAAEAESVAADGRGIDEFVEGLNFVVSTTAARRNLEDMVELRALFARLADYLDGASSSEAFAVVVLSVLRGLIASLERSETTARVQQRGREQDRESKLLRERVYQELRRRRRARPRDLIAALHCGPTQVSRALRELEAERRVAPTPAPLLSDRRARWYRAVRVADAYETWQPPAAPGFSFAPRSLAHEVLARLACAGELTGDDLRHLSEADNDDLQRALAGLKAWECVSASGDRSWLHSTFRLTARGKNELFGLTEAGFEQTVDEAHERVPEPLNGAAVLIGAPGSGKREVARELARLRDAPCVSIGSFIRSSAPEGTLEHELREVGERMIETHGWEGFLVRLIRSGGVEPGVDPIVIDGSSPYPDGIRALRELYEHVYPVFLDAPDWMRELRHKQEQEAGFDPQSAPLEVADSALEAPPGFEVVWVQGTEIMQAA